MAGTTRLELSDKSSHKFWEVSTKGAQLVIRFGRIGSAGQTKLKTLASPAAAKAEADKQIAAKKKGGYSAANGAAKPKVEAVAKAPGPKALGVFKELDYAALWLDGKDVWMSRIDDDDEQMAMLRVGASLAEVIASSDDPAIERWRFSTPAEAKRAASWMIAHAGKKAKVKGDTGADPAAWNKRVKTTRDRIPRLEVGAGPIAMAIATSHDWIYPRPPSTSYVTGRVLVPACSLVGALDPRFGKKTGVFISVCPTGMDQVFEVAVQDPAKPSAVDAYFQIGNEMRTIHLGCQVYSLGSTTAKWCVVEHDLEKGTTGYLRTTHCKSKAEAEKLFADRVSDCQWQRAKQVPAWYRETLREIDRFYRANGQQPKSLKLRHAYGAHSHAVTGAYSYAPSNSIEHYSTAHHIGGTPNFCQEEWSYLPPNPCGKDGVLHLITLRSGDVGWSYVLNDGDAGSLTFFAAPGAPFGTMSFSCH